MAKELGAGAEAFIVLDISICGRNKIPTKTCLKKIKFRKKGIKLNL